MGNRYRQKCGVVFVSNAFSCSLPYLFFYIEKKIGTFYARASVCLPACI